MNETGKTLVFCISPHGYGHASQTAGVVNGLLEHNPNLDIVLKTTLPPHFIKERFHPHVKVFPKIIDFGMIMASSIDVLSKESWQQYATIHAHWETHVQREYNELASLKPQLIISNIAYVCLEAAYRLNTPSVAMSSLNWADIFEHYCHNYPDAQAITQQIRSAYNRSHTFIQFTPCPPMTWLQHASPVSPITRLGNNLRDAINREFGLSRQARLILIGLGGIAMRLPIETWPLKKDTYWLIPDDWAIQRDDCIPLSRIKHSYIDTLCSVDALITKPGYGTFSEAVCNQVPFLYVSRGDWPEEPFLEAWAKSFGNAAKLSRQDLYTGNIHAALEHVLNRKMSTPPPTAEGAREAADIILGLLKKL